MKKIFTVMLLALVFGLASSNAFADADTPGSSTDFASLQGSGDTGQTTFTNVHTGQEVTASSHVAYTDAARDGHPFNGGAGGGD